ncbi:MAG: malate dehydrogenase [Nitrospirae bacterium]|nr:malate dehydrogenase [Nitrospirota bacterium]
MNTKVSVLGAGNVGATTAHLIVQSGLADVVLFDISDGVPQGKALDLAEARPLWNVASSIVGTNDFGDTRGSDIIVVTAGLPRKPGMSRDDLLHANAGVIRQVVSETAKLSPDALFIVVTNPMDVMTQISREVSGFKSSRVIGMGGILDASRFRTFISFELGISPEDIETIVLGGHGDFMVPLPEYTTVKGIPLKEFIAPERINELIHRARNGGAEIVALLKTGSAYYAPAASVFQMVKSVILDEKRLLPCAALLDGEYGIKGTYVGVPVILGRNGVEKIIELNLTDDEAAQFSKSAHAVREMVAIALSK